MTKAESQARAYAMENLEGYHPMVRDFILGKGIFSHAEEFKMHMRVADRIAEHARAAFREQFAKEFNDHRANAIVEVPTPPRKNVMPHAWSSDPARDAKVRMQEDGRSEPHKTLEEAIYRAGHFGSPEDQNDPKCTERESGLRTERVTLDITHDCFYPASEWVLEVVQEACSDPGESVRVVEECCLDRINMGEVIRERDEANERRILVADELSRVRARVAELESAPVAESATTPPPARGWLTEEEREAVQWAADAAYDKQHPAEDTLRSILARSTPPEVVLPITLDPFSERLIRDALSAAGVTVREATK